ncbi:hypothetical protein GS634_13155 [Ruegeria atlantica]|uniref:Uncharacterized protein n=1 Tax=Ruegeria atlantica TaxID=81569 RepID=A0AA90Z354_9RHOB|nr:hypothetical protein [Ruegeria sp. HKCCD6604]NOE19072.1 hypothetical protein [Ruegeria atlantica]
MEIFRQRGRRRDHGPWHRGVAGPPARRSAGANGLAMDAATSDIGAVKLSPNRDGEGPAALIRNETLRVA